MEFLEETVIRNIVKIRTSREITKRKVAEILHIDEASYGRIENGKIALTYSRLAQIASALSVSVIDIITYPDVYVKKEDSDDEPIEAILQIKLQKDKKNQVLKLIFGDNNLEILNK